MGSPENACFHCGEPIPDGVDLTVSVDGRERAMCCAGCQAVTQLIFGSGLGRYYQFRQELGRKAEADAASASICPAPSPSALPTSRTALRVR